MKILIDDFKLILKLLVKHEVGFMLIGGYAVIYYGYDRTTGDLDIFLEPSEENKPKLINALREFGIRETDLEIISGFKFSESTVFHFGKPLRRIDFLTRISGVGYYQAIEKVISAPIEDIVVPVIYYHHLILSKIVNERPKDKADRRIAAH